MSNNPLRYRNSHGSNGSGMARCGLLLCLLLVQNAVRAEAAAEDEFMMVAFADVLGAPELLAGQYRDAIRLTRTELRLGDGFAANNNLCIAYARLGELKRAEKHCSRAMAHTHPRDLPPATIKRLDAVVHSNRGVIRTQQGQFAKAERELLRSVSDHPEQEAVARNLVRLKSSTNGRVMASSVRVLAQ